VQELPAGQHHSGVPNKGCEQREFAAGQIDFPPVQHRAVREQVDGERPGLQRGTRLFPEPQPRANPGRELIHRERLGHIVVGAGVQPVDLGTGVIESGKGDDRQPCPQRPELGQYLQTALAGQDQIEQDKVDFEFPYGLQPGRAVVARGHDQPPCAQPVFHDRPDSGVVLDQQDMGHTVPLLEPLAPGPPRPHTVARWPPSSVFPRRGTRGGRNPFAVSVTAERGLRAF
jgi:hypothetical protein